MAQIELNPVTSGYSTGVINDNFEKVEEELNNNFLRRDGVSTGQPNQMNTSLDMNGFPILNIATDWEDSGSLLTVGYADSKYVNSSGDSMSGPLSVQAPVEASHPVRKVDLQQEKEERVEEDNRITRNYQNGDASLQTQITGDTPVLSAERSVISWHGQVISNSMTIPENVNAFTVGPEITLEDGVAITVGEGSTWSIIDGTIAQGE